MKQLTQEDFRGAPDWVVSAAVDADGDAWGYSVPKKRLEFHNRLWVADTNNCIFWLVGTGYDSSDWQNSAIDRRLSNV